LTPAGFENPQLRLVFHVAFGQATSTQGVRNGWTRVSFSTGNDSVCSCMFAESFGTSMSRNLKPYTGGSKLLRWESDTATTDDGTAYQSYGTSKAYLSDKLNRYKEVRQAYLQGEASTGTEIQLQISRDFGREVRTFSENLDPLGAQTRVRAKYETAETVDA